MTARREDTMFQRYGLTIDCYHEMLEQQGGACAICKRPPRGKTLGRRLYVDHDAVTGAVRGLLCPGCNTALGQFLHDPTILSSAIDYLINPRPRVISIRRQQRTMSAVIKSAVGPSRLFQFAAERGYTHDEARDEIEAMNAVLETLRQVEASTRLI